MKMLNIKICQMDELDGYDLLVTFFAMLDHSVVLVELSVTEHAGAAFCILALVRRDDHSLVQILLA